jgi:hypothetical protein
MISKRSVSRMALATALVLLGSCSSTHHQESGAAVRADGKFTAHAQVGHPGFDTPEYVESDAPPAVPQTKPEERTPAPSVAHVWIDGAHTRQDGQWKWVGGHWAVPPRDDVVWVPGHWVPHLHGYAWIPGAWR